MNAIARSDVAVSQAMHDDYTDPFNHDPSVERTVTPLWKEAKWGFEWARLRMSRVYLGRGVPRGNGSPVLLVPGFMAGDAMMLEMHWWLRRIGYKSYLSNIIWNNDCPDKTAKTLAHRVRGIHRRSGRKVTLVGHSLGGLLAKSVGQDQPDWVQSVVTMGSPHREIVKAHPAVVGLWDRLKLVQGGLIGRNLHASCGTGHCTCVFVRNMLQPRSTAPSQFAIYSKSDGVVDWTSCIEADAANNAEVKGTHIGMVSNAEVFRALGHRLAEVT
jgi:pimeloyl-ACP methyl ester carboxylesterase